MPRLVTRTGEVRANSGAPRLTSGQANSAIQR
jgi:hypothetical protein